MVVAEEHWTNPDSLTETERQGPQRSPLLGVVPCELKQPKAEQSVGWA